MGKKYKINSAQFNYQYGDQIHFPYSVASIMAYAIEDVRIRDHFSLEKTFIFRDKIDQYIERCIDSDILLCSCYVWNWNITTHLAKRVKEINPDCLIIFGGPQVPSIGRKTSHSNSETFFEEHKYVDIVVHGEGEITLKNLLLEFLNNKEYKKVNGIQTKNFTTPTQERIKDLEMLPSPYLTNLVWHLSEKQDGVKYIASWETNRGCPFKCTFCDWGSYTNTRMRKSSEDRLYKEIEWFSENKIPYIDCCDANFGIYKDRDHGLAKKFKEEKLKTGYPEKIRPAWVKASSERIIPIAKELQSADLLRAVTLAVQSLDANVLKIIERKNIKFDKFSDLAKKFRDSEITTYTEFIMGLPGETVDSFKRNMEEIASLFPRPAIYIYNCGVFPNAPMNANEYKEKYDIKTIKSPIFLAHSSIHDRGMVEYEDIVVGSNTFTKEDLIQKYLYGWMIQSFHSLGIFEFISKFYNKKYGLKYVNFYSSFLSYCKKNGDNLFSGEYKKVVQYIKNGYNGGGWNHHDPDLGDIFFPFEEATWLRFTKNKKTLFNETLRFLNFVEKQNGFNTKSQLLTELINFQLFILTMQDDERQIKSEKFKYDWKNYYSDEEESQLKSYNKKYFYKNQVTEEDKILKGYKIVWYGRGSKKYKIDPVDLSNKSDMINKQEKTELISVGAGGV
jgi:radical SAM superfamily enzyme YgiQ (UPF0313 family)